MLEAFSTAHNRVTSLVLLVVSGLSATAAVVVGIDDNLPGILLAFLAAITFVLAFVHPWRTARKFMYLLLTSVLGIVLFIILNIVSDSLVQNPTTSDSLKNLIESPAAESVNVIFAMLCPAAFIIGVIGSVVMFIHNRSQTK